MGDAWCCIGIERNTKLVLAFELGKRTETSANAFMAKATDPDCAFQLTTDGLPAYAAPVERNLGDRVNYAQYIKVYALAAEGQCRYRPPRVITAQRSAGSY